MYIVGRVYRVMSEAYPSTARSRDNLVSFLLCFRYFRVRQAENNTLKDKRGRSLALVDKISQF